MTATMLLMVSIANAGLFDAVKKVGSGLGNALDQKVCDDGGLGGCNGTVETYKDGNYCQVHLQKRKNQQNAIRERIARQEANERRNKAEASENLARAKREYAARVSETEKAGQRWLESVKQDGVWGVVEIDGKTVEGRIVPKDTFREDKPEYVVISGFLKPPEPEWDNPRGKGGHMVYLPKERDRWGATREEKFEGRRYDVVFQQFTTNNI